jgi:hypothetical protein
MLVECVRRAWTRSGSVDQASNVRAAWSSNVQVSRLSAMRCPRNLNIKYARPEIVTGAAMAIAEAVTLVETSKRLESTVNSPRASLDAWQKRG